MLQSKAEFTVYIDVGPSPYTVFATGPHDIRSKNACFVLPDSASFNKNIRSFLAAEPLSNNEIQLIGSMLFESLFSRSMSHALQAAQNALPPDTPLRIRIDVRAPELATLPWETLYHVDEDYFIALRRDTPMGRTLATIRPERASASTITTDSSLKLLHTSANPSDYTNLDEIGDYFPRELTSGIEIERLPSITIKALQNALLSRQYHILHFDGHGYFDLAKGSAGLILESIDRRGELVTVHQLSGILSSTDVKLVVLVACNSGKTGVSQQSGEVLGVAQQIFQTASIPAVVGIQHVISHVAAQAFAQGFYQALSMGRPVDQSMVDGRLAIQATGQISAAFLPVLFLRTGGGVINDSPITSTSDEHTNSYYGKNLGDGALAQGPGAIAVGKGGMIIQGDVHGNISQDRDEAK